MSHVTTLRGISINDVRAIELAVARLQHRGINVELTHNNKPRVHGYDAAPTCEMVLNLKDGEYDVGLKKQDDGNYELVFDTYLNHVGKQIGASCPLPNTPGGKQQHQMGQFLQLYAEEAARNQAMAQGYTVENVETDAEGNVNMTLVGM